MRYGLLIGLFFGIPYSYESSMIYPITLGLAHAWLVSTTIVSIVCGVVFASIYKTAEA